MISITPHTPLDTPVDLKNKAIEIYKRSAKLEASLRPGLREAVTHLLQFVNSYYSNKIEGNKAKPSDVVQAQHSDDSEQNPAFRDGLKEIVAHVIAQRELAESLPNQGQVSSPDFIRRIHELLFKDITETARKVTHESTGDSFLVEPGAFREQQVQVGKHIPLEAEELRRYMNWFHDMYRLDHIHGDTRLLAAAASHHRLVWIHPFLDGNGRVTRLFTDVYMRLAGVDGYGLWSISRGFSRSVDAYKAALAQADKPRQGSTDGRGILSDKGLITFQQFFMDTCLEQIDYLTGVLEMEGFDRRLASYVGSRFSGDAIDASGKPMPVWRPETERLLFAIIAQGGVMRSEVPLITGLGETLSRNIVKQLVDEGWIKEEEKKPLKLEIPFDGISALFPHLW